VEEEEFTAKAQFQIDPDFNLATKRDLPLSYGVHSGGWGLEKPK
jgi:hypothetical protein